MMATPLFIEIWNQSKNVKEVIEKTGCGYASLRACKLRKEGYELKRFSSRGLTIEQRFFSMVTKGENEDDCWKWNGFLDGDGYGRFTPKEFKKYGKCLHAHRCSWIIHFGDPRELHVLHHCDNPQCTNPRHLFLGSNKDNVDDRVRKGRTVAYKGEKNGNSVLTVDQVKQARELAKTMGVSKIMDAMGLREKMDYTTVWSAVRGDKNWRWLV